MRPSPTAFSFVSSLLWFKSGLANTESEETASFLQGVLGTGPLSTGPGPEAGEPLSFLEDQLHLLRQQIAVGAAPHARQKFDALQLCLVNGNTSGEDPNLLKFQIHPAPSDANFVTSATLRILSSRIDSETVQVFQVVKGQPLVAPDAHRLLSTHFVSGSAERWLELNVLPAVGDWLRGDRPNLGLLVTGLQSTNDTASHEHQPMLVIKYDSGATDENFPGFEVYSPHNGTSIHTDEPIPPGGGQCRRRQLWVDLRRWGFLEPSQLDVGSCSGLCTRQALGLGVVGHTGLLAVLSESNFINAPTAPSCVPTSYGAAAVMYRQLNGNFVLRKIQKMVAINCGCR